MNDSDEFYIGYEPSMPSGIAARLRRAGVWLALVLAVGAGVVLAGHPRLAPARFDFGHPRQVDGVLERLPYPSVLVDGQRSWLVGEGKYGADAALASTPDGPIVMRGTAATRGSHRLFEVVGGSVSTRARDRVTPSPTTASPPTEVTLTGEIVDSKCFLGVMNPGAGTVHRDCARVCLRGGIPPLLLVRGASGEEALVVLVSPDGTSLSRDVAARAGHPVRVRGLLRRDARGLVLATTLAQIAPVASR